MITQLLLGIIFGIVGFVGSLFPSFDAPSWLDDLGSTVADLASSASGFVSWVPFGAMVTCAKFVFVAIAVALVVKVVRLIVSLVTGGGGSAA